MLRFKNIAVKSVCRVLCFLLSAALVASFSPPPAVAIKIGNVGNIVGAAKGQEKIRKSLEYYENDGRGELFAEIKKSEGVNPDPTMNAVLDRIMQRLSATVAKTEPSIKERPYNYFVNTQEDFNAFCTLGHNISVNTGVFYFFANNEDKIAAVVAHEMVHGQRNHPIEGAKKKLTVDFLQKVVGADLGGAGRLAADVVAVNVKNAGITKPNEWEADNIAFLYLADAGYNVGAPAAVWQRVIDNTKDKAGMNFFNNIFNPSTHPSNTDRRANYAKKLTEYSNNKISVDETAGEVKVNGKPFLKPAAAAGMSGLERAYLIAGNLAAVYHAGPVNAAAVAEGGAVRLGGKAIVTVSQGDPGAAELAAVLNNIK
ncbi:MAG: M48 family metallopeptidase [Acidaminococcales bacterium]|jgi:predicted Zn-dependent protease|nr:M48 family metallopeptidase [Acidaminococcales bacterium]